MPEESSASAGLQFEKAEFSGAQTTVCTACREPVAREYFLVNGAAVCAACHSKTSQDQGSPLFRALGAGLLSAAVWALVWWGIEAATGLSLGIVAVLLGVQVGNAVRGGAGSGAAWQRGLFDLFGSSGARATPERRGPLYQALAMALTYTAISAARTPLILDEFRKHVSPELVDAAGTRAYAFWISLKLPFLLGTSDIMGLIIIGIALRQAWIATRALPERISGPFQVQSAPLPAVASDV